MEVLVLVKKISILFSMAVAISVLGALGLGMKRDSHVGSLITPIAEADAPTTSESAGGECGSESCCGCEGSSF